MTMIMIIDCIPIIIIATIFTEKHRNNTNMTIAIVIIITMLVWVLPKP